MVVNNSKVQNLQKKPTNRGLNNIVEKAVKKERKY